MFRGVSVFRCSGLFRAVPVFMVLVHALGNRYVDFFFIFPFSDEAQRTFDLVTLEFSYKKQKMDKT